ncbi:MAG: hypothetical protein MUE40_15440 [Anaerolineae bacterium]|jgi:hypothetical protein|nr:hypothetical protein [Anaerolineae bacterium]
MKKARAAVPAVPSPALDRTARLRALLNRVPRLLRILLAALAALAVTAVLFPLVDAVYVQFFFTPETRIVPSYVSVGAGALMYLAGWLLLVGPSGGGVSAHPALPVYVLVSLIAMFTLLVLLAQGISMIGSEA